MTRYVVIGGGIVGLATAYRITLDRPDAEVTVLEKEPRLAAHQTGHNSGVIHAGVYYRPGSLKARLCRAGNRSMVDFCRENGVPVRVCGKLIVAIDEPELPRLRALYERAVANGLPARLVGAAEAREYEPAARCLAALHVASTGIVDFTAVCAALARLARDAGASVRLGTRVTGIEVRGGEQIVHTEGYPPGAGAPGDGVRPAEAGSSGPGGVSGPGGGVSGPGGGVSGPGGGVSGPGGGVSGPGEVVADVLVNCAGLHADRVARLAGVIPPARIVPFRGEYYELRPGRRDLVRGLIYPVPDPRLPFLGVHLTRMIDGTVHAGPNAVLALAREGYSWASIDPRDLAELAGYPGLWRLARRHLRHGVTEVRRSLSRRRFAVSLARLVPELTGDDIAPTHSGVRAQAVAPDGSLVDDFLVVRGERQVHVLNAPSPAATSSLEIARHIVAGLPH
ncbi:L-2-hydroxyglutarate oxidase [Micromonospora sp. NPDC049559]|uniref:L-2-hydroxyglutarate oxidase n=1 Tax=Micromonospora sp. NPDC049559 TaxID=3155923 RepID=UPI0034378BD0